MFGLSYSEIILVLAVAAGAWLISRRQARRREPPAKPSTAEVETLTRCAACGDYVAATGAVDCRRDGCPRRDPRRGVGTRP